MLSAARQTGPAGGNNARGSHEVISESQRPSSDWNEQGTSEETGISAPRSSFPPHTGHVAVVTAAMLAFANKT